MWEPCKWPNILAEIYASDPNHLEYVHKYVKTKRVVLLNLKFSIYCVIKSSNWIVSANEQLLCKPPFKMSNCNHSFSLLHKKLLLFVYLLGLSITHLAAHITRPWPVCFLNTWMTWNIVYHMKYCLLFICKHGFKAQTVFTGWTVIMFCFHKYALGGFFFSSTIYNSLKNISFVLLMV